jgi:dolichol-phosphate mannosyltransferase
MVADNSNEKLTLVVPTLREAGNLPELLRRTFAALQCVPIKSEVIVVDDDSRDGTVELVELLLETHPQWTGRLRVLVRKGQRGLAGAVLHGWRNSDGTMLGVMDADLQHPPELLPDLLYPMLGGADLAVASRYKPGGSTGDWNALRRLVSNSATWMTKPLLPRKLRVKDPMSGFFIIQRRCVEGLRLQTTGFKLLLELLVRAQISEVAEVCFTFGVRHAGASKANLTVAREYARLLLSLYIGRKTTTLALVDPLAALMASLPVSDEPNLQREALLPGPQDVLETVTAARQELSSFAAQ